jgi:hypothetical protein
MVQSLTELVEINPTQKYFSTCVQDRRLSANIGSCAIALLLFICTVRIGGSRSSGPGAFCESAKTKMVVVTVDG